MANIKLEFAREPLTDEVFPLWEAHWKETEMYRAGNQFNPDVKRYKEYAAVGFYQLFTARASGVLVGDLGVYVTIGMHDQHKTAIEDTWYVIPEYRRGRNAVNFLRFVEADLKVQGVTDVYATTKLMNGAGRILEFCGYEYVANQYWKAL